MKYEQHLDSLEGLTPEQREAIQLLCLGLSKNSGFQIFFEYYINKFVTDSILEMQKNRRQGLPTNEGKLPDGLEVLEALRSEIIQIAGLTEEIAKETAKTKS